MVAPLPYLHFAGKASRALRTYQDPLQKRPCGDDDGQVRDRFGLTWLIGFGAEEP